MVSGFTLEKLGLHVVPPYWFTVREETGHAFDASSDSKISGFAAGLHVTGFIADLFFPLCRADLKISGFVWTRPKSILYQCIWGGNMLEYLSADIICSDKRTVYTLGKL